MLQLASCVLCDETNCLERINAAVLENFDVAFHVISIFHTVKESSNLNGGVVVRQFFSWSACVPCIEQSVFTQQERGELAEELRDFVGQGLQTLRVYCTEMELVCINSDQMATWLQRHDEYEEFLFPSFEDACESCTHQHESVDDSWINGNEDDRDYPIMPRGLPHPRWRDVFERGDRLGVCYNCIEDRDNIDAFVDLRYVRAQPQIPTLIMSLVETCSQEFELQGRVPVEIEPDMYMAWVEQQTLTAPWYAFSVTARYIWRFLRNCDHMFNDFTPENE